MVTATGWTLDYIRSLDIRDCWSLTDYWSRHPPVHVLMAAGIGAGYPLKQRGPRHATDEQRKFMERSAKPASSLPPHVAGALRQAANERQKPSSRS